MGSIKNVEYRKKRHCYEITLDSNGEWSIPYVSFKCHYCKVNLCNVDNVCCSYYNKSLDELHGFHGLDQFEVILPNYPELADGCIHNITDDEFKVENE